MEQRPDVVDTVGPWRSRLSRLFRARCLLREGELRNLLSLSSGNRCHVNVTMATSTTRDEERVSLYWRTKRCGGETFAGNLRVLSLLRISNPAFALFRYRVVDQVFPPPPRTTFGAALHDANRWHCPALCENTWYAAVNVDKERIPKQSTVCPVALVFSHPRSGTTQPQSILSCSAETRGQDVLKCVEPNRMHARSC